MRALLLATLVGCSSSAVDMTLLLPTGGSDFDMTCVTAVDLLPVANGDDGSLDLSTRTDASCATVASLKSFNGLQPALAGKFDLDLPKAGLEGVVMRGRAGTCEAGAKQEAVFYGGGGYKKGEDSLQIKVNRGISCGATHTFSVHPTDMVKLFGDGQSVVGACSEWTDTTATIVSAEIRETNFGDVPLITEIGKSSAATSTAVVSIDSFSESYPGSCAALKLHTDANGGMTGAGCINTGVATACAGANVELAVVPDSVFAAVDALMSPSNKTYVSQYGAPNIVGVYSATPSPGNVSTAQIKLDDNSGTAAIVYGNFSTDGKSFTPSAAQQTTMGGVAVVFTNHVVGITISKDGKSSRHMYIGASPDTHAAYIATLD